MGHVKQKPKSESANAGYRRLAYFQTKSMLYWFQKIPFLLWLSFFTLFKAGFLPKQRNENWKTAGMYTSTSATNTINKNNQRNNHLISWSNDHYIKHESQWFCCKQLLWVLGLILWKIMSPSPEPMSLRSKKKKKSPKLKMLGPLRNQKVHLRTDSKTLCNYNILKLKYSPSILKHNRG